MKLKKMLIYIILIISLYIFMDNKIKKISFENSNPEFLNILLQNSNYYFTDSKENNIFNNILDTIIGIEIENPITVIDKVFAYNNENVDTIQTFAYIENNIIDKPRVYIYSTHPNEKYSDNEFNVVEASNMLKDELNSLGIQTIVETKSANEYIKNNNLKYEDSYIATRKFLTEALNKYGDFDLIIDLHRDSVSKNTSTVFKTDEKSYAKIMFVMNQKYSKNYQLAEKINNNITSNYGGVSRGIYHKYIDNFNQDLSNNVVLIELGSSYNSYEEVKNSIEILAETIKETLNER